MKQALEPAHFPFFDYKAYSFSLGLETPSGIWLSGHTASEHAPATNTMIIAAEGDLVAQARVSHAKIQAILQAYQHQQAATAYWKRSPRLVSTRL